ncbi:hypothetical protein RFI_18721 [Reticulomyxa filosa]|uniref:Calcium-regulated actin-bundling protein C-terminal domain-containing protein n=1 Tax=Reticulomyxa filosa TaxID=46433 RepID=X6MYI3_RETFI|nr:hypothetical protein RFI_18721 [Reticulomyxa filosa]|eukprot:ETO18542.1 hypothetical protein RFI_18721 [Reticulomyxa filosa]
MTATERVAALKEIDIDTDKRMSLLEFALSVSKLLLFFLNCKSKLKKWMGEHTYSVWRYKSVSGVDVPTLMSRPQGTNQALKDAEQALKNVQKEIQNIESKKNDLEKKSQGEGVKARSAANELAQLLSADQTELNKLLLTAEASLRKAQKSKDISSAGSIWWLNREIDEAKKYKPKKNIKSDFVKN